MPGIDIKRPNTFNIIPHTRDGKVYSLDADENDDKMEYTSPAYVIEQPKPLNFENKKCYIVCPFCKRKVEFSDNYVPKINEIKDCDGCNRHLKVSNVIKLGDEKLENMENQNKPDSGEWEY